MMTANRIYGGVLFLVAALIFATTFSEQYASEPLGGDVSTVFMPRIFLLAWMFFAVLIFFMDEKGDGKRTFPRVDWRRLGAISLVSLIIAIAMLNAGFLIATIPGLWVFTWIFGYRKPVPLTVLSIVLPIAVWFLFSDVFLLPLPSSPWFESF